MELLLQVKLPVIFENLTQFIDSVSACAHAQGFRQQRVSQIKVAMDEAIANIVNYSYPDNNGDAEVVCSVDDKNRFVIEIMDWGVPFNVLSLDDPDLISDIPERKVGGLGVFMIKQFMDDVKYRFEDNKNILTLIANKESVDDSE
ncbi:MAG: ATP-binding protein [Deltaproteobacteria bacterium]|nr:ATP-binding protein [Deltaproteobacteria bacterium]